MRRSRGSRVAKSWQEASVCDWVRALKSVDLPALVYPTSETVGTGTDWRKERCSCRCPPHPLQIPFDLVNSLVNLALVRLQLGLSRTARPDSPTQAGQFHSPPPQSRQPVVELGQLDLQLSLPGSRTAGEDIQDELGSVDDFAVEDALDVALLGRGKVVVEDHGVGPVPIQQSLQEIQLPFADQIRRVIAGPLLQQAGGHPGSGGGSQGSQLIQRFLQVQDGSPGGSRGDGPLKLASHQDDVFSVRVATSISVRRLRLGCLGWCGRRFRRR